MNNEHKKELHITQESDLVDVRRMLRDITSELGFGITDTTRIITAASELARNIYRYADSGLMRWCILNNDSRVGLKLTFEDKGPGIADVEQAMVKGYSTSGGLGMGLPGTKRLMDEMEIHSEVGKGTVIIVCKWRGGR